MLKQLFTIKNLILAVVIIFGFVVGIDYLKVNKALLEETRRNNTFQRRLSFENALIQKEIACQELGKLSDPQADYYFDNKLKHCRLEINTGKIGENIEINDGKYRGLMTDNLIEDYNLLFMEFISLDSNPQ